MRIFNISMSERIFTKGELENDYIEIGFSEITNLKRRGIILGIGRKQ